MKEAEVVSIICEHLQKENWQFWIDDHEIHKDLNFKKHRLLIGGARPDIYGLNNFNQIFAVEVKGLRDYKKAIGQALTYKSGVNISFIGGISSKLNEIRDIVIPSGLGLIFVNDSDEKVEEILNPLYNIYPYYLEDIKNEILMLQSQKKKNRSFTSFGRTHLLNYFSPLFLFSDKGEKSKQELISDLEKAQWKNKAYPELVNGANIIGVTAISKKGFKLSKVGKFCLEYFNSMNISSLEELQVIINQTGGRKSVYSEAPHIAKFLQLIYFQNPDFKKFIMILLSFKNKEIRIKQIIDKLVMEYPNLFLNFFVKPTAKDKVIEIFLRGNKDVLQQNYNKTISEYGHYNFFFAFKRHLVHLGILSSENKTFYGKTEDFDVNEDIWILGEDILI